MISLRPLPSCLAAFLLLMGIASKVYAVSYASGILRVGDELTYTLNQDASDVIIHVDAGSLSGPVTKGTHTVDIADTVFCRIDVYSGSAVGWTQISNDADSQNSYFSPRGVVVDRNPMRWTFGRIYVSEGLGGTTGSGRTTTDGLYILGADGADITSQGDTAYGGGVDWSSSSSSPFKLGLNQNDPDGQDFSVYISDWSDGHSGLWTASAADPAADFPPLLDNTGRDGSGLVLESGGTGPGELHGSIPCGPWVEGSGRGRLLLTMDEDVRRGNVLQYDIGTTAADYSTAPTDRTDDSSGLIVNGLSDVVRDGDGSWWIAQHRYDDLDAAPALSHWADGATVPGWKSGPSSIALDFAYGSIDIHDGLSLLALGTRDGAGIYIMDISDPDNPQLQATVPHNGYIRDVAFDAAGNLYVVSSSTETLRIWSPGGSWITSVDCGADLWTFSMAREPVYVRLTAAALSQTANNACAVLTWKSSNGEAYNVQRTTNLLFSETWSHLISVTGQGTSTTITNSDPLSETEFFRVELAP